MSYSGLSLHYENIRRPGYGQGLLVLTHNTHLSSNLQRY